MSTTPSPAHKCLTARSLLLQVEFLKRTLGHEIPCKVQRSLDRLQYRAENLAGEAGFDAAINGTSGQVPESIHSNEVLAKAFISEFTQVIDHFRFEATSTTSKIA